MIRVRPFSFFRFQGTYIHIYVFRIPFQSNMLSPNSSCKTWQSSGVAYSELGRLLRAIPIEKLAESFSRAIYLMISKRFTAAKLLHRLGGIMFKSLSLKAPALAQGEVGRGGGTCRPVAPPLPGHNIVQAVVCVPS